MTTSTAVSKTTPQRDIKLLLQSDRVKEQIALALPRHMTPDRMVRVALTSINKNPALLKCTPESLLSCMMQCSQIGLEPDGRNAHLIPYGDKCTLIVDWKGLVSLARDNGVVVTPKLVCKNDTFIVKEDDGTGRSSIVHCIDYTKPRGDIFAVYSRAKVGDDVDYEIMTKDEVEQVRINFSRAKDADAWKKSWGEMAKKTVIRRHSKRWPLDAEKAAVFEADVEPPVVEAPAKRPVFDGPGIPALPEESSQAIAEPEPGQAQVQEANATQPTASEPEPTNPDAAAEAAAGLAPEPPNPGNPGNKPPFTARPNESEELTQVRMLAHVSDVTESQVMAFCQKNKLAKPEQKQLSELAGSKLKSIASSWDNILPDIRGDKPA